MIYTYEHNNFQFVGRTFFFNGKNFVIFLIFELGEAFDVTKYLSVDLRGETLFYGLGTSKL